MLIQRATTSMDHSLLRYSRPSVRRQEVVPGFTSILHNGIIQRCVAYYDKGGKQNGRPINSWATALWHMALKREGYEQGLWRTDGTIADWLTGNVVVVCRSAFNFGSAGDPMPTMLR